MNTLPNFALQDLKPAQPVDGWQEFLAAGTDFLNTAAAAYAKRVEPFNAAILYNLIAMAVEKFIMSAMMSHGALPYNHTMADLAEAMETTFPGAVTDMKEELLGLDAFQDICDLDGFSITPPEMEKIPAMLVLAEKIKIRVSLIIPGSAYKSPGPPAF